MNRLKVIAEILCRFRTRWEIINGGSRFGKEL